MECRYCNKPLGEDAVDTHSYWKPFKYKCHPECKKKGEQEEAYECQKLDADCNDCFFYERKELINKGTSKGICKKFNKETFGHPNFSSGHKCFEHRKDFKK